MYSLVKEIRDKSVSELAEILKNKVDDISEKFDDFDNFGMHRQNRRKVKFLLARITSYLEKNIEGDNRFEKYLSEDCQIEHIWADKFDEHHDEFTQRDEFEVWRNKIGALLLLCGNTNQSYNDLPYEKKLRYYFSQNILAKSLHPDAYERNPDFIRFIKTNNLPFKPHKTFKKKDIESRQELYKKILEKMYNKGVFDEIINR